MTTRRTAVTVVLRKVDSIIWVAVLSVAPSAVRDYSPADVLTVDAS
jgi:hypothetical protein